MFRFPFRTIWRNEYREEKEWRNDDEDDEDAGIKWAKYIVNMFSLLGRMANCILKKRK